MASKVRKIAEGEGPAATVDFMEIPPPTPKVCSTCAAWVRDERDQLVKAAFGGCAKTGKTTSGFGEDRYVHYTTDTQHCSQWQPKEA